MNNYLKLKEYMSSYKKNSKDFFKNQKAIFLQYCNKNINKALIL